MQIEIKKCPMCGGSEVKLVTRDVEKTGPGGIRFKVPALEYAECADCGERYYDREALIQIEKARDAALARRPKVRRPATKPKTGTRTRPSAEPK